MAQVPALTIAVLFCVAIVSGAAAPPDFADQSGQRFLYMAFAAYQHNGTYDSLLNWSCPCCTALNTFWPATRMSDTQWFQYLPRDLFAYVGYEHSLRSVVLSFRGSQDLENWIVNLQFAKTVPYGDNKGKVHSGFYHGYLDMKPMLLPYIRALMQRFGSANILCTGHSLGGAMAQLAAVDLSETLGPSANVSSVTYGTPRTGDAQWASYFASTLRGVYGRIVHWLDIVPHLPPLGLDFHHTPREAWYDANMTSHHLCSDGESFGCSDGVLGVSVDDHLHYYRMSNGNCIPDPPSSRQANKT